MISLLLAARSRAAAWRPLAVAAARGPNLTCSLVLALLSGLMSAAHAAPYAYLTTNGASVPVLDLATNTVERTLTLSGPALNGVALNRQGTRVYLSGLVGRFSQTPPLYVIDATTHTVLTPIPLNGPSGASWGGVVVNPAGDRVYVANPDGRYIAVVDPAGGQVVSTIAVTGKPANLALNASGSRLYVANAGAPDGDSVLVLDTQTHATVATVGVTHSPLDLSFNPQGTRLYVVHNQSNTLSVIDTTNHTLVTSLSLNFSPSAAVVSRDGSKVYVSDYAFANAKVAVLDARTNSWLSSIPVGNRSTGIGISPDGSRVLVSNFLSGTVSVIDTATDTVVTSVPVSNVAGPRYGLFIGPDTRAVGPSPTGSGSVGVAVSGGGATCRVTNPNFTTAPGSPPDGMVFVHGVVSFTATPCTNGARVTVTLSYPKPIPSGAVLYKYSRTSSSPTNPVYTPIAATVSGNTLTYTIEDGGVGDDDLTVNGQIVDPVGLGVPFAVLAGLNAVPTLSAWGVLFLSGLMGLVVVFRGRRAG